MGNAGETGDISPTLLLLCRQRQGSDFVAREFWDPGKAGAQIFVGGNVVGHFAVVELS